jgi:type II secretory pathway component PulF
VEETQVIGLGLLPLGIPGVALLITLRLLYAGRGVAVRDPLQTLLTTTGRLLVATSLLGLLAYVWGVAALFAFPILVIVAEAAVTGLFAMERRALLAILASTAERGIPLPVAIRAYVAERKGWGARRAIRLAGELEAGLPLHQALLRSRVRLPAATMVAVQMAHGREDLGEALRDAVDDAEKDDRILAPALEKLFLLSLSSLFALGIMAGVLVLLPRFTDTFVDLELEQISPEVNNVVVQFQRAHYYGWFLLVPALLLSFLLGGVLAPPFHFRPRNIPLISRLFRSADLAGMLRLLALSVRGGRSLADVFEELSQTHPARYLRRRLKTVSSRVSQGGDWCDALAEQRLIRRADAALLKAASRLGNLSWALEDLADNTLHRSAYGLRRMARGSSVLLVLVVGVLVALFAIGMMLPLASMTEALS